MEGHLFALVNNLADPSNPGGLPIEIWQHILLFCDVRTLLRLERTCSFFLGRLLSRVLWHEKLQELDKERAPDLPAHIAIETLNMAALRDIVVRSERRYMNCMGPDPLKATRKITIPIGESNADSSLGTPIVWGADTLLLPGRKYFLTKWPAGYLQCWNTETKELEWAYPERPEHGQVQDRAVLSYTCDILPDGNMNVAMVCDAFASPDQRSLRIMHFDTSSKTLKPLYDAAPTELDVWHGMPFFLHISGDVCMVYTEGQLLVFFWKVKRTLIISQAILDFVQIVEGLIVGVKNAFEGNCLFALPLKTLMARAENDAGDEQGHIHLVMEDIAFAEAQITSPRHWLLGRAQLSICTYHWQKRNPARPFSITVFADVYDEDQNRDFPVAMFFTLSTTHEESSGAFSNGLPKITLVGTSQIDESDFEYSTYSVMNPPSQAGSTILAFYDDRLQERRFARTFSTFSTSDMSAKLKPLDETMIIRRPATYSLNVEYYSGTIYYVSADLSEAVILSID